MSIALLLVDIQNDYFPGGRMPVDNSIDVSLKAKEALSVFRANKLPVIHVQHVSTGPDASFFLPCTKGVEIHANVQPTTKETIVKKHYPNGFRDTNLRNVLLKAKIKHVVICGMMTHTAIDATARAAYDAGFRCTILHDACAAKTLEFNNVSVSAGQVHHAFIAALQPTYAKVASVREFLQVKQQATAVA